MGSRMATMYRQFRGVAPELRISGIVDPDPQKVLSSLSDEEQHQESAEASTFVKVRQAFTC